MKFLALDIGTRRTGVAYLDEEIGIPLPLEMIVHASCKDLIAAVQKILRARRIDCVIVGLPLLPSGAQGAQAAISRGVGELLKRGGWTVQYVDERYSTPRRSAHAKTLLAFHVDGDAAAACALLEVLPPRTAQ